MEEILHHLIGSKTPISSRVLYIPGVAGFSSINSNDQLQPSFLQVPSDSELVKCALKAENHLFPHGGGQFIPTYLYS